MQRTVSARMELGLQGRTNLVFAIAGARPAAFAQESLTFVLDGAPATASELDDVHGTRLHRFVSGAGRLLVEYTATVAGRAVANPPSELDVVTYLRPSRYCESDALTPLARSEFAGLSGHAAVAAVVEWVADRLSYEPSASSPTGGAEHSIRERAGVCRDYAHVVIAVLRALDIPARMVSVYAPGLSPMDFHAVAEAFVDGAWWVVDATRLAPRQSLLRIATGRDAADTAFLTSHWTDLSLDRLEVMAIVDELPVDDGIAPVQLG